MQAVLYTQDLEPITVVSLSMPLWEKLRRGEYVRLMVIEPLDIRMMEPREPPVFYGTKTVTIFAEPLYRGGQVSIMIFTRDEELAMLLKADFLPGQRGDVQRRLKDQHQRSFMAGFMQALRSYGE